MGDKCDPQIGNKTESLTMREHDAAKYKWDVQWINVTVFLYLHIGCIYGVFLLFVKATYMTIAWAFLWGYVGGMGITAGAHRLWAHKSYQAKWPLRLLLALCQAAAFQNDIYEWVRDHRAHHKFTDTDADPHNSRRGFFFSHIGWLVIKKHPDVKNKGKTLDMSDLKRDPIVMWQRRWYKYLVATFCFILPTIIPWLLWNESFWVSWYVAAIARYTLSLNSTWLVNSAAHIWGTRPYDKNIHPSNNLPVALLVFGEGWHNYHHVFPWDYKAAELGNYRANFTTAFIDFFAKIGWAYNLKSVSAEMVMKRMKRTGDISKHF